MSRLLEKGQRSTAPISYTEQEPSTSITLPQRTFSACCGAVVTSLFVTPLDVVKIRLQQQHHPVVKGQCFLYCNGLMDHLCVSCAEGNHSNLCKWYERPGNFTGTRDAFMKIARNEGIRSLWSGLSPTLVMAVPATVFYFSLYDHMLVRFRKRFESKLLAPVLAGACARFAAVTLVSPLEMVRTKLQSEQLSYREVFKAVKIAKQSDGWLALWRGWGPTILRDLPFSAIYWAGYETFKQWLMDECNRCETTFAISFSAGAISGTIAALVTLPFDVVKTHRQVTLGESSSAKAPGSSSKSTYAIMQELVRSRGWRSLYAGAVPRVVKIAPACAIMIGSYEFSKLFFAHRNRQHLLHKKSQNCPPS